ncbi:MAG: RDD family protein [Candidatus Limnocylindrales bacterium]
MTGPGPADSAPADPAPADPAPADPAPAGAPPAGAQGLPAWTSQLTSTAPVVGPAGLYYADVPNRIIAQIIDAILVGIVGIIIGVIVYGIVGPATNVTTIPDANSLLGVRIETSTNWVATIIGAIVGLAISAGYYIYTWTAMRGTVGQKLLGMQVGNAADGATLTMEQAARRWLALGGIFSLAQFLNPLPLLGILIGLASLVWVIALLVTTAQSPTKQGLHDQFANTVVVKAARAVG